VAAELRTRSPASRSAIRSWRFVARFAARVRQLSGQKTTPTCSTAGPVTRRAARQLETRSRRSRRPERRAENGYEKVRTFLARHGDDPDGAPAEPWRVLGAGDGNSPGALSRAPLLRRPMELCDGWSPA